jgi:hypothetical protein
MTRVLVVDAEQRPLAPCHPARPRRLLSAGKAAVWRRYPFSIVLSRQMCRINRFGFPDKAPKATSVVGGLRTGDMVRAVVAAASVKAGVYVGRLAVRATGSCNVRTAAGTIQGIPVRCCTPLHRGDGYAYADAYTRRRPLDQKGAAANPPQA